VAFEPGDKVTHVESGERATVYRDYGEKVHVFWDDDQPAEDFGGSVIATELLRRVGGSEADTAKSQ
jgi:hypothetical protein